VEVDDYPPVSKTEEEDGFDDNLLDADLYSHPSDTNSSDNSSTDGSSNDDNDDDNNNNDNHVNNHDDFQEEDNGCFQEKDTEHEAPNEEGPDNNSAPNEGANHM
jgi:hypothetical protein